MLAARACGTRLRIGLGRPLFDSRSQAAAQAVPLGPLMDPTQEEHEQLTSSTRSPIGSACRAPEMTPALHEGLLVPSLE